jgi:hypothetical protein
MAGQTFAAVPTRSNSDKILASWFNALQQAGLNVEGFLGAGYLAEARVALTNGQATPANIAGLSFDSASFTSARVEFEINQKTATNELVCNGTMTLLWRALTSSWDIIVRVIDGDEPGITLTVSTTGTVGQVKYTLGTLAGTGYVGNFKFKAISFGV